MIAVWTITDFYLDVHAAWHGKMVLVFTNEDGDSMHVAACLYPEAKIWDRYCLDTQTLRLERLQTAVELILIEVEL